MHSRVKYALAISHAARAPRRSDRRGSASASWFVLAVLAARQHSDGCQFLAQITTRRHPRRFPHVGKHPCRQEQYYPSTILSYLTYSSPCYHTIETPRAIQSGPWHVLCVRGKRKLAWALVRGEGMYRHIMVVTGDQLCNDAPVKYAMALAAETGAELALLMILSPPLIAGMADAMACTLAIESIMSESEIVLANIAARAEQAGIACTTRVRWGSAADAVLRTAGEDDYDLIIVGSHAWTCRGRRLLRHVIKQLTTCARQPLLIVTEPPEETYRGTSWARLLVVHDGSPAGEAAVSYARALAYEAGLDVCL